MTDFADIPLPDVMGLYVLGPATEPPSLAGRRAIVLDAWRQEDYDPFPGKPSVEVRTITRGHRLSEISLKTWDPASKRVGTADPADLIGLPENP